MLSRARLPIPALTSVAPAPLAKPSGPRHATRTSDARHPGGRAVSSRGRRVSVSARRQVAPLDLLVQPRELSAVAFDLRLQRQAVPVQKRAELNRFQVFDLPSVLFFPNARASVFQRRAHRRRLSATCLAPAARQIAALSPCLSSTFHL